MLDSPSASSPRTGVTGTIGVCGCGIIKVSRRETGVSKVRNSLVADMVLDGASFAGVSAGIKLPLRLERARGSIDLRRLWPPRGTREVSIA